MKHLFDLMQQIVSASGGEVTIDVPEENFNLLMLKVLRAKARRENRTVRFNATDPRPRRLIASLEERAPETEKREEVKGASLTPAAPRRRTGSEESPSFLPHSRKLRKLGLVLLLMVGVLLLLGAAAFAALYYLPRAEVILTLSPIPLVKEVPLKADTSAKAVDGASGVVPGTLQEVEESGTKTADATGTATVGEKAQGIATFDSIIDQSCTSGSKIKGDVSELVFLTDSSFNITASETKEITITAEKIGANYNLAASGHFTILSGCTSNSQIEATNADAFTGGTSEEVTVATVADQTKLLEDLQKELVDKAKETIHSQSGIDEVIVESAIKTKVLEKNYSHAVGEQAEEVSLTLEIKLTTITYKGADIQEFISQALLTLIPPEFALFPGETEVEALDPKLQTSKMTFTAKISAQVIPKIDEQKIKEDLAGRNPNSAQEYLSSLSDITSFELKLWPNLPSSLQRVPRNIERITVGLKTEEQ